MERTDANILKKAVGARPDDANKGTMGTLLCVCGSYGMAGAARLACEAALRCGVGLCKAALPESIYPIVSASVPECVYIPLRQNAEGHISSDETQRLLIQAQKADAVLIGCGLSVCGDTASLVRAFLESCETPTVLDADALNIIASDPAILKTAKAPLIITPHPGEMARLIGSTAREVNADREKTAREFARKYGVITVLKGSGTLISSPDGRCVLNTTGNSGMATGGSGDVLAGITASLLAQGANPFNAAAAAAYVHGLAGDIAAAKLGKISMLPRDIINCLPESFMRCGLR